MQLRSTVRNRQLTAIDYAFLVTLAAAVVLLVVGLTMPAFTNDRLAQGARSFSILSGAFDLGAAGNPGMMLVIILFSAAFPTAKLAAMLSLWTFRFHVDTEKRSMQWLEVLGKWSMLDVFVLATTIGAAHLRLLNRTTTETGIYVFGLAILLSMLASILLRHKLRTRVQLDMPETSIGERLLGFSIGLGSLMLFFFGVTSPLFSIEKWVFWDKEYSLITALPQMIAEREYLLPAAIVIFVVVLPLCRFLSLSAVRSLRRPPKALVKLAFGLEKWTMWEVYALALIIVAVKLGDFTELEFRLGFWLIMAMVPLSVLDGWLFKRRLTLVRARAAS